MLKKENVIVIQNFWCPSSSYKRELIMHFYVIKSEIIFLFTFRMLQVIRKSCPIMNALGAVKNKSANIEIGLKKNFDQYIKSM